ncbi:hypothetical protein DQ384_26325 [Sphaerisporangium album]|uniref:Uncharacterized protein n=1 Tax=Sphaerisporangium album TaxID=509200 RepID=A0A367FC13_9ACTN|nr:hypothetical protein [Sphaerisporangium album]RCG27237.1 hypothetical protein DQ384_26325 [Sphaerisporangium album]
MLTTDQRVDRYLRQNGGGSRLTAAQFRRIRRKEGRRTLAALAARQAKSAEAADAQKRRASLPVGVFRR